MTIMAAGRSRRGRTAGRAPVALPALLAVVMLAAACGGRGDDAAAASGDGAVPAASARNDDGAADSVTSPEATGDDDAAGTGDPDQPTDDGDPTGSGDPAPTSGDDDPADDEDADDDDAAGTGDPDPADPEDADDDDAAGTGDPDPADPEDADEDDAAGTGDEGPVQGVPGGAGVVEVGVDVLLPAAEGDSGDHVAALQRRLAELGMAPGTPDGSYGRRTSAAVEAFQGLVDLEPTGQADAATVVALTGYRYDGLVVRAGDEGDDVETLQALLQSGPFDPGPVDGQYGTGTVQAVWALEKLAGMPVDGDWGPLDDLAWQDLLDGR